MIEEKSDPTEPEPRQPVLLPSGDVDEEAELVFGADDYAPTEASPVGTPTQQSQQQQQPLVQDELSRLSEDQRRNLLDLPVQMQPEATMEDAPAGEKREAADEEPQERKSARLDREGSPSSSQLYAPFFAGKVELQFQQLHDDECWEEDMDWEMVEFDIDEIPTDYKGEQPPELLPEDLEQLDGEAMKTEVDKLSKLGVVKVLLEEERDPNGKFVDLREVFDWRKRDGQWRRRCRIVARDFKTGPSNEDTFSPTSPYGVIRFFLMCHLIYGWKITCLDISDAYLTVPQVETCYVATRPWIQMLLSLPSNALWELKRVLPGQRNGAQRWFNAFSEKLRQLGFVQCQAVPSVLRHERKKIVINVHVDDELIASETTEDALWLIRELKRFYKLQIEGPYPVQKLGNGEEVTYLKKSYLFAESGLYVRPNSKYIESLLALYDLRGRKEKQVPDHSLLCQVDASEDLDGPRQAKFRSGLGIAMYLAHDRVDIQFCVKTLASWMKSPTVQAEKALIQLILYLSGTRDFAFHMPYSQVGTKMVYKLNSVDEYPESEIHCMEVYCDSDWAGGPKRRSTTSVMILMNGLLCLSFSRMQKSTALSSCEAEVLAMTAGASEALLVKAVWTFMVQQRCEVEMRSDSSSGRQWLQRTGLGRLKHVDVRLCWLQSALKQRTLDVLPIGTKLNLADLNTKKLSQARRQFLLYFLGVVRLNDEGKVKERVGEQEYLDSLASEMWKQQIQNVTRWSKNRTHKLVQCAMMLQAISLKGCGEQDAPESAEQSGDHQVVYTLVILMILGVCNYLCTHWNDFQRLRERLGRKRNREGYGRWFDNWR